MLFLSNQVASVSIRVLTNYHLPSMHILSEQLFDSTDMLVHKKEDPRTISGLAFQILIMISKIKRILSSEAVSSHSMIRSLIVTTSFADDFFHDCDS